MLTFNDYLLRFSGLTLTQITKFKAAFNTISSYGPLPAFHRNLYNECRFDKAQWDEILATIQNVINGSVVQKGAELQHRMVMLFQGKTASGTDWIWAGQKLSVPNAIIPAGTIWGRAVPKVEVEKKWSTILGVDHTTAGRNLNAALQNPSGAKAYLVRKFKGRRLGSFFMWSTFDPANPLLGPFHSMLPGGAYSVEEDLGLPASNGPLILFRYTLDAYDLHIPNVANAYAGRDWHPYFSPNCASSDYGETFPKSGGTKRPEVIHLPITAADLDPSLPLKLIH